MNRDRRLKNKHGRKRNDRVLGYVEPVFKHKTLPYPGNYTESLPSEDQEDQLARDIYLLGKGEKVSHRLNGLSEAIYEPRYEKVHHPAHYGGSENPYEAIKVIEAWKLNFNLGTAVRYISRAGKKPGEQAVEDLQKAAWYLNREIENLKKAKV